MPRVWPGDPLDLGTRALSDPLGSPGESLLQFGHEPADTLLRRWQPAQPGREPGDHLADGGHPRRRRCADDVRRGLDRGHATRVLAGRWPAPVPAGVERWAPRSLA